MPTVSELMSQNNANAMMNYRLWGDLVYVVTAYDIFPDGTDVTNKLQALVNLANSQGRTAIFFPAGEYFVTYINNDQNIYYFGDNASFVGGYGKKINNIGSAPTSDANVNVREFGAIGNGVADDTLSIRSAIASLKETDVLLFPPGYTYRITDTIDLPIGGKTVMAYEANFLLDADKILFNLNPNASPTAIESTSQSYGFWYGGNFLSTLTSPTSAVAIQFYGLRQMVIRDVVIGRYGTTMFSSGLKFAGLGGHLIEKVRFIHINKCMHSPDWGNDGVSSPVTTSTFNNLEFILAAGQKAFEVLGGWNRWRIFGGFANVPSGAPIFHFNNNYKGGTPNNNILIQGVGFEQPSTGSVFLRFEDVNSSAMSNITIQSCAFIGNPSAGGVIGIDFQRCRNIRLSGCRFEQTTAASNTSVKLDANCLEIDIDRSNYFSGAGISNSANRIEVTIEPIMRRLSYLTLTGYNGNTFSSSTLTLDMRTLLGGNFPVQLPPLGYWVQVQARDSASSTSTSAGVEIMQDTSTTSVRRMVLNLAGVANSKRISAEGYVPADASGNIALQLYSSGSATLELWVHIVGIHN